MGNHFYHSVSHRRYGGDLQGVIDKLDYLQDLGITAIYFNPVFQARSLHKYDASSMHHIDPHFGPDPAGDLKLISTETEDPQSWHWTAADKLFLKLIREIHRRDMKLIIDGVFNHTGRDFFAFADLRERQAESDYRDWYIVHGYDDPTTASDEFDYEGWWGSKALPVFADSQAGDNLNPAPRQYVFNVTRRWMDPDGDGDSSDGIDGWRLDVANEVPAGFWIQWHRLVRELNPEAYTVGEFWGDARKQLLECGFSSSMNYYGFAYPVKGFLIDGNLAAHDFGRLLKERLQDFPPTMQFALQNLIDSHDTDRVASMIVNAHTDATTYLWAERFDYDVSEVVSPFRNPKYAIRAPNERERAIQRLVALMQMTFVGPPMIYYGTESGMWGADDPCNRQPMVWNDLEFEPQMVDPRGEVHPPDAVHFDDELFAFYRALIHLRRQRPELRRGDFEVVDADDAGQFIAFRRSLGDACLMIAINRRETPYCWELPSRDGDSMEKVFAASGKLDEITVKQQDGHVVVTIPALDAVVLVGGRRDD